MLSESMKVCLIASEKCFSQDGLVVHIRTLAGTHAYADLQTCFALSATVFNVV